MARPLKDKDKTKDALIAELRKMRARVDELEKMHTPAKQEKDEGQKWAETAFIDSGNKFRFLTEKMNDLIWTIDLKMHTTYVSPSIKKMLGFTQKERMAQKPKDQLTPASYKLARKALAQELMTELKGKADPNRIRVLELEYYHKDGSTRMLENLISGIRNRSGRVVGLHGVSRDITERINAEKKLRQSLKEKEVLLKEVNHRVKNNLNMINSLLVLQAEKIKTKEEAVNAFKEIRNRIFSIATVHERLYQSDVFSTVDMRSYIEKLAQELLQIYEISKKIEYELRIDDISISINKAIPCGLILNELISNALMHAFTGSEKDKLIISFRELANGLAEIMVKDNGVGLSRDIDVKKAESMGLQLITILTEQLNGKLSVAVKNGTEFKIIFPLI